MPQIKHWPQETAARRRMGEVAVLGLGTDHTIREIVHGICAISATRGWLVECTDIASEARRAENPRCCLIYTKYAHYAGLSPESFVAPFILAADIDCTAQGLPSVVMNDIRAGELAAAHLMDTGIRSFGFFGQSGHRWADQRCEGFTSYIRRHCPTACISTWMRAVHTSDNDEDGGFNPKNVVAWLQSMPRPVGVMAACDDWARHLLYNCRLAGLNVPEDVAVVGVDNDEFCCQTTSPPISSVILPLRRLGAEIGLMVDCLFSGRPLPRRRIVVDPTQIAVRRSSDVVAIPDPDVAAALAYIRRNAHRPISVADILEEVPTTQRRLERGFQRHLGRTMLRELRRMRIRHAEKLLVETDLTIERIATQSGFTSRDKFFQAFRQQTGLTPAKYRQQVRSHVLASE